MTKRKKTPKKVSGWKKLESAGRKGIMITVSPQEHELLTRVASARHLKVATYVKYNIVSVALTDYEKDTAQSTEQNRTSTKPKKGK
jgi:hypothetical protein